MRPRKEKPEREKKKTREKRNVGESERKEKQRGLPLRPLTN